MRETYGAKDKNIKFFDRHHFCSSQEKKKNLPDQRKDSPCSVSSGGDDIEEVRIKKDKFVVVSLFFCFVFVFYFPKPLLPRVLL